jgi:predicted HTH domain antitoxin
MGKISLGFLAEMLGMDVIEADRWLSERGIPLIYSCADLEADRCDLTAALRERAG